MRWFLLLLRTCVCVLRASGRSSVKKDQLWRCFDPLDKRVLSPPPSAAQGSKERVCVCLECAPIPMASQVHQKYKYKPVFLSSPFFFCHLSRSLILSLTHSLTHSTPGLLLNKVPLAIISNPPPLHLSHTHASLSLSSPLLAPCIFLRPPPLSPPPCSHSFSLPRTYPLHPPIPHITSTSKSKKHPTRHERREQRSTHDPHTLNNNSSPPCQRQWIPTGANHCQSTSPLTMLAPTARPSSMDPHQKKWALSRAPFASRATMTARAKTSSSSMRL